MCDTADLAQLPEVRIDICFQSPETADVFFEKLAALPEQKFVELKELRWDVTCFRDFVRGYFSDRGGILSSGCFWLRHESCVKTFLHLATKQPCGLVWDKIMISPQPEALMRACSNLTRVRFTVRGIIDEDMVCAMLDLLFDDKASKLEDLEFSYSSLSTLQGDHGHDLGTYTCRTNKWNYDGYVRAILTRVEQCEKSIRLALPIRVETAQLLLDKCPDVRHIVLEDTYLSESSRFCEAHHELLVDRKIRVDMYCPPGTRSRRLPSVGIIM
jgi:hypothetical protein